MSIHRPDRLTLIFLLLAPALFATNMVAGRWAQDAHIPPLFLAFSRWALAFLLILPVCGAELWRARRVLPRAWPGILTLGGLGMGLAVAPQYVAAQTTNVTNISLIVASSPLLVAVAETVIGRQGLAPSRLFGMILAMAGVLVIIGRGEVSALTHLAFGGGDAWVVLAAAGWAAFTVLMRRITLPPLSDAGRLAVLMLGGVVALLPFAMAESLAGHPPAATWTTLGAVAFLAVFPGLGAYFAYARLILRLGPGAASSSLYLIPLFACLLAWPILGEMPAPYHLLGMALVLPGVALINRPAARRRPVSHAPVMAEKAGLAWPVRHPPMVAALPVRAARSVPRYRMGRINYTNGQFH